ncbi:actin-like ATPase domain-containing protein [Obba rivulosa]|uniref:Actin-like ATPase domain-containing protein n=1 Tax=Obba rivulosa TaxID=1052685 RepID=A0A8E2DUU7_9APHY|nr:actin-like ATPase domain-containing protein [Obba rivulosa]
MPRGIPNAKRDESAMRYTSFHVPLAPNPKHLSSTYLKSESQTVWYRNAVRGGKTKGPDESGVATPSEARRGSKVLVIHPGSRFLRVGRASDVTPVTVPNVIARKHKPPVPPLRYVEGIARPRRDRPKSQSAPAQNGDEYAVPFDPDDPFETKLAAITISLRDRMRFYKLRVTPNAASIATTFNESFVPETIPEANDPFRVDWITEPPAEDFLVGEKALRLSNPVDLGYVVRRPMHGGKFNTRDYSSIQLCLSDIETILRTTLKEKLQIEEQSYQEYSVVLVIPDFYDRFYVQGLVRMLLITMGFKQLCAQQESLAATYGAGISNACVVDMGATKTSIACVDDGFVLPETRMLLDMGGDDITEFLYVLFEKIGFPYKELDLTRSYDWAVIEDLKARLCTLAEGDVALNLYDFVVRRPGKPTEKYGLRAYDETILAPMCLFEPRVIEFDQKREGFRPVSHPDVTEGLIEQTSDYVTQAMVISTQHLLPTAAPATLTAPEPLQTPPEPGTQTPGTAGELAFIGSPQPAQAGTAAGTPTADDAAASDDTAQASAGANAPVAKPSAGDGSADAPMEIADDEGESKAQTPTATANASANANANPPPSASANPSPASVVGAPEPAPASTVPAPTFPGGYAIDVCFEASKLPLDVAIFNSARAAGGDEKIRKYLQAVLVVGGAALVPGMAHALESRLQAIATPLVPNMEKVQVVPAPKDVDPRVLAWKGAAVLGKMDGVADLWVTPADWDLFGMRALKERCFYL